VGKKKKAVTPKGSKKIVENFVERDGTLVRRRKKTAKQNKLHTKKHARTEWDKKQHLQGNVRKKGATNPLTPGGGVEGGEQGKEGKAQTTRNRETGK